MDTVKQLFLAAPQEYIDAAAQTGCTVANMIYRIGRGYHLYRAQGTDQIRGGVMVVDTDGYVGGGPQNALVSEIIGECEKKGFSGIVLDTAGRSLPYFMSLAVRLGNAAEGLGVKTYVPEALAAAGGQTVVLLPTALSGGTLADHIGDALTRYGPGRVALEIERVRMDFSLPAVTGTGKELTEEELQGLVDRYRPSSFLSRELCAWYFTYRDKKGTRFVLYDNAASIRRKLSVAAKLGVETAFMFFPQVADIIDKILAP